MDIIISKLENTKQNSTFMKTIKTLPITTLNEIKKRWDDAYYNGIGKISDEKYDLFYEYIQDFDNQQDNNEDEEEIITSKKRNKVKLPIKMDSLDKIKQGEQKKIENWVRKFNGPYCIMPKLDGISCLVEYFNGNIRIFTKGNKATGFGMDISDIQNVIKFPKIKIKNTIYIRGELIMYEDYFQSSYAEEFKNARSFVSGAIMSKSTPKEILEEIHFITYEIYVYEDKILESKVDQLKQLKNYGFEIVPHTVLKEIDDSILYNVLVKTKKSVPYYIDGIVISDMSTTYTRNEKDNTPDYAFAYKMLGETKEAIVETVEWAVSKRGLLKPRVKINPVVLNGSFTITFLSGYNGRFIEINKIGKGAKILITRSGDVIPKILEVITPAKTADMPSVEYHWNENGVECVANNDSIEQCIASLIHFFKHMNVENLREQTILRLYEHGMTNLEAILTAKVSDFEQVDRFGTTLAQKIYDNIQNTLKEAPLYKFISASGLIEDVGSKRIELLLDNIPDLFTRKTISIGEIEQIQGFSNILATKVIDGIPNCKKFLDMMIKLGYLKKTDTVHKQTAPLNDLLKNQKIVFTGFRDSVLENKIKEMGGTVSTTVSKNTTMVIVKDINETSGKITKARDLGIEIISLADFTNKFKI